MKKTIATGLIGLIALGGGAAVAVPSALAQGVDDQTRPERTELRQEEREAHRAQKVATLSEVLGVSIDELEAAYQAGQTVADVAAAQGLDLQTVIDAIVAEAQAHIDQKVAAGEIDAERAQKLSENLVERITARVNGERPEGHGPGRGEGPRHPRGPRGLGGPGGADATAPADA